MTLVTENPSPPPDELIIEAGRIEAHYWRDLWRYRELLGFLAWRDVKVRYKQAVLGSTWALVQPVVTMILFTFVFGRLAGMASGSVPYPLLVLAGLLPWQLFSAAFSGSSNSIVSNAHLISKVYFPRLVVPLASLAVALIDFLIVFGLFMVVSAWFGIWPTWRYLFLPLFMLAALIVALGGGIWLTAVTVKYRDFRFVSPFLLQVGIFVTPVGYRTDNLPNWRGVLALNPLTGVIDGFRWCLLGGDTQFDLVHFSASMVVAASLLGTGLWFFRRMERNFADSI